MENSKAGGNNEQGKTLENPNFNNGAAVVVDEQQQAESTPAIDASAAVAASTVNENDTGNNQNQSRLSSSTATARTPFTNLSQVDADLALARTLQDQERAYMMLRMHGDGSDYGSWEGESFVHEDDDDASEEDYDGSDADADAADVDDDDDDDEDAFDVHARADFEEDDSPDVELDATDFPSDEAYARALQDAEDREMAARLMALAGMNEMVIDEDEDAEDEEDHGANSQDTWEDVDPDELSYEELIALGEVVGTESRGLSADSIASLPSISYKAPNAQDGNTDTCVICRLDYEDGDFLTVLSCKHSYHTECITNWLQINKVCPVCSAEVSTAANS